MTPDASAEAPPQLLMPTFAQKMQVEVAHHRRELVRIVDRELVVTEIYV